VNYCLFCGGDTSEPGHAMRCDGRQGRVEAALEPVAAPYAPHENVRTSDPSTSHAAALALDDEAITVVQGRVLDCHHAAGARGLTDEELLAAYVERFGVTAESSPRKRRNDLTKAGAILDSGERRPLVSGRQGIVWKLAALVSHEAA
jgi:hypothetical protein